VFITRTSLPRETPGSAVASSPIEKRTVHAVGDGTFIADGRRSSRRKQMASKIPAVV